MKLRWSETAADDLQNIYEFIARDKPDAALATIEKLIATVDLLLMHPHLGRPAELDARKLIHPPFVIVYRIVDDVISIEAVFHGKRRYD